MGKPKIAFTGGGTGGHIYPNLAIIEDLKQKAQIYYFGHPEKLEAKLLKNNELKDHNNRAFCEYVSFVDVRSEPLLKSVNPVKLWAWYKRFNEYRDQAIIKLKEAQIELVFGTGGYAAGPVFAACQKLKIPYIIHNLDAHMGLANRAFVKGASALSLGVCDLKIKPKKGKVEINGNPVSNKFLNSLSNSNEDKEKFTLLVTGGSQGAQAINDAIGELLPEFAKLDLKLIHVTGAKNYEEHKKKYFKEKYDFYELLDYTHEMPKLCAQADIAVCRSGAMTIAEMLASETMCIFIPLPWAAHDHQTKNAQAIADQGAAICLDQDQKDLKENLLGIVKLALSEPNFLKNYKEKIKAINKNNAKDQIIKLIFETLDLSKC